MASPVVFTPVSDYAAAVEGLANKTDRSGLVRGFTLCRPTSAPAARQFPGAARRGRRVSLGVHYQQPVIQSLADLKGKRA